MWLFLFLDTIRYFIRNIVYSFLLYTSCENRQKCTHSKNGRYIDRSEYANIMEANARRINESPEYYKLRQQVTEHPFGTLKRQRGFTFTLVRSKEKVPGEVGLMFIGYNLSRCVSILGAVNLIKALKDICLPAIMHQKRLILSAYFDFKFPGLKFIFELC